MLIAAALTAVAMGAPLTAHALAKHYNLNIPRQPLDSALKDFAQQTGLQIARLVRSEGAEVAVGPVSGDLTVHDALAALLAPGGLTYQVVNERTIAVVDASKRRDAASPADSDEPSAAQPRADADQPARLEEIVVTAQKRQERLSDVPIPVTALTAESLVSNNQVRLQDYYTKVPGLSYTPGLFGQPFVVIRGITAGASASVNPLVGIMIDEVPYGSSTGLGGGGFGVPDIDPADLARVEVLRGPQGTLYGASNLGGLIKFVTIDPTPDRLTGRIQAGLSDVRNGDDLGYSFRGSINVPLGDTWAIRASGFTRQDPGYIDNPSLGLEGVNEGVVSGGRVAAMWRPSETLSLKLSALLQDSKLHGPPYIQPTVGDLQQSFVLPDLDTRNKSNAYSATLSAKAGAVDITAASGYSTSKSDSLNDYTPFITSAANLAAFGVSGTGTSYFVTKQTDKFTQEIRATTPIGQRLELLAGAFYTHEKSDNLDSIQAVIPSTGAIAGHVSELPTQVTFAEYAGFADLTVHFTDRFDVQVGGRESRGRLTYAAQGRGLLGGVIPETTTHDDSFTYLLTPRFRFSPDVMAYARFASGYRPGGPNTAASTINVPSQYSPDKTLNYELGLKGDFLDHALTLDASVFYIDWKDVQIQLREPVSRVIYYVNGGRAKSQGVELSVSAHPMRGLTIAAWGTWNEAQLTESFPTTSTVRGVAGDRLPFSAKVSGNLSVQQEIALGSNLQGFFGGSASYVGDRQGSFTGGTGLRQDLPSYTQLDLNAGIRRDTWTLNAYANNVTDRRGVLIGGLGFIYPNAFNYIPPRTVGLSLVKNF
jgi:outer membrane receptor protein involved in Fe transport